MSDEVITEYADGLAVITINRPQARNAVDRAVAEGIATAIDELDARQDLKVGIITGAGDVFCSGMDLKAFLRGERPHVEGRGFAGLAEAPPRKPLIAAVEGYAVAGGCELVLASDLVVAAENAKFGLPEVRRGLVAVGGGLLRLPARIPYQVAMELALTGDFLTAERAYTLGLVNRLTSAGGALAEARRLAAAIAANGPLAVRVTKHILVESRDWPAAVAFERQQEMTAPVFTSRDAQEGARAFAEKRTPTWTGE
ncbi:crotonase/enoyl-CoA hydratase family protein [Nonomuraea sp. NEAU-A123]|uniref:crotonase/enoyl-CoA hydratase family protein n=1 Tax=Nonomuraea sp. NEAU-A123 TaxID=2839649 RepID=UPI001BE46D6D|nr:crotonase/enoyl-CoA hydratase family protein [Nonomuraea sp. NEAU-A123]MBT2227965.1 crotonase/enoyl-CoA hydratase family protein [Nonomuraea sp. NEAU-A123]